MSLGDFISYLKSNLTSPADQIKCLHYLENLSLSRTDAAYAHGMLDRWISVGLFNGTLSVGYMCQDMDANPRQPCAAAEEPPPHPARRHWVFSV